MVRRTRNRVSTIQSENADAFDLATDNPLCKNLSPQAPIFKEKEPTRNSTLPGWIAGSVYLGLGFFYMLAFVIAYFSTELPYDTPQAHSNHEAPLSFKEIPTTSDFLPDLAYAHLSTICNNTHYFNQRENLRVQEYLVSYVQHIKQHFNSNVELVEDNNNNLTFVGKDTPSGSFGNSNVTGYFESSNVLVKVPGVGPKAGNALLVSAHYDSVPLSYGANDNGIGLVTALEIIRLAALNPLQHDLIVNLNNHEESGLLGSVAFMKHPWSKSIKSFVNLEGSGAGGRVVLFQCSNPRLVELARGAIPRPHMSVLGNDLFQLRVLNSITDFAIYSTNGRLPGVDFAIYNNRAVYHTIKDDLNHAYRSTIQHMGQSIWPLTMAILNSDFLDSNPTVQTSGIFYDFLGLVAFHYSFSADLAIGLTLMLLMVIVCVAYVFFAGRLRVTLPSTWLRGILPPLRAFLSISVGIIMFFALGFGFNSLILRVNLLAIHRYWLLVYMFDASLALLCLVGCDWVWRRLEARKLGPTFSLSSGYRRFQASSVAMLFIWFLALAIQRVSTLMQVGLLYYVTWFGYCFFIIYAVAAVYDPVDYWSTTPRIARPKDLVMIFVQIIIMVFLPTLLLHDSAKSVILSLSQSLITGTPGLFVYTFASIFPLTTVLPLAPFLSLCSDHHRWTFIVIAVVSISLLLATLLVAPLNETAPMTFYWTQVYNVDTGASPALLRGLSGLALVAPAIINATSQGISSFDYTFVPPFSAVTYNGLVPNFPVEPKKIINLTTLDSSVSASKSFQLEAIDTRECRIMIPTAYNIRNLTVGTISGNNYNLSSETTKPKLQSSLFPAVPPAPSHIIYLFRRSFNDYPWTLSFQYTAPSGLPNEIPVDVTCYYDDFDHIPAIKLLHQDPSRYLPDWATLSTGAHILEVKTSLKV